MNIWARHCFKTEVCVCAEHVQHQLWTVRHARHQLGGVGFGSSVEAFQCWGLTGFYLASFGLIFGFFGASFGLLLGFNWLMGLRNINGRVTAAGWHNWYLLFFCLKVKKLLLDRVLESSREDHWLRLDEIYLGVALRSPRESLWEANMSTGNRHP